MSELSGQLDDRYRRLLQRCEKDLKPFKGNLLSVTHGRRPKTLLVTSSKSGEGKTLNAINLAHNLAASERASVLLLDLNAHSPHLHQLFQLPAESGFANVVLENVKPESVCFRTEFNNLQVMPYGNSQLSASDVFESERFIQVLNELALHYTHVVVDAASILNASEVILICPYFDGVLMVIECESTRWEVAQLTAEKIRQAGGNLVGSIMNRRKFYIPRIFYG